MHPIPLPAAPISDSMDGYQLLVRQCHMKFFEVYVWYFFTKINDFIMFCVYIIIACVTFEIFASFSVVTSVFICRGKTISFMNYCWHCVILFRFLSVTEYWSGARFWIKYDLILSKFGSNHFSKLDFILAYMIASTLKQIEIYIWAFPLVIANKA